jgi:cytochrome c
MRGFTNGWLIVLALAAPLAGCGKAQPDAAADTALVATTSPLGGAPRAFGICLSCHSVKPGQTVVGPSLFGVYGTRAGDVPGYAFTADLKKSGLVWNDATLDRWLTSPVAMVPGTRMGYAGQPDPAKRAAIIAYLKTLH